jgi:alkyl sulfatase BDS1-like metallo-beta-lactamase superfamily hydrolase
MLGLARDGYRFINDETLRLANHGLNPTEIAEQVQFTPELDRHWGMRGYYGSLNHNVKATYVNYLGWFDGNPSTLHTLPPVEAAKRYVDAMGGAATALGKAREAFGSGEYRWAAELLNHLVFADPDDTDAKALQADVLEQLGYQSESGPWRNFYLSGATELRQGVRDLPTPHTASPDSVRAMEMPLFFDFLGMRLNGAEAGDRASTIVCDLPDVEETWTVMLRHGTLSHHPGPEKGADATLTIERSDLNRVILKEASLEDLLSAGTAKVDGDAQALHDLLGLLDDFEFWFNIVTP